MDAEDDSSRMMRNNTLLSDDGGSTLFIFPCNYHIFICLNKQSRAEEKKN